MVQPQREAFQTARSKLAADAKKSGHALGMDPAAVFSAGNDAGPAGAPRAAGLARPNPKRGVPVPLCHPCSSDCAFAFSAGAIPSQSHIGLMLSMVTALKMSIRRSPLMSLLPSPSTC